MTPKLQQILTKVNQDNIWNTDINTIKQLQHELGIKEDGLIGKKTISALQSQLGVKEDGLYGNQTKAAINNAATNFQNNTFYNLPFVSEQITSNTSNKGSFISNIVNKVNNTVKDVSNTAKEVTKNFPNAKTMGTLTTIATNMANPHNYMPYSGTGLRRTGTVDQLYNSRMSTVIDYLTNDFGSDVSYNTVSVGTPSVKKFTTADNYLKTKKQFQQQYYNETGIMPELVDRYPLIFRDSTKVYGKYNPRQLVNESYQTNYNTKRADADRNFMDTLTLTKTPINVETINIKANGSQPHLTADDKKGWISEYYPELMELAELRAQYDAAAADYNNAASDEEKQRILENKKAIAHRIASMANARKFKYNGRTYNTFPDDYSAAINKAEMEAGNGTLLSPESYYTLVKMYNKYGISPQWSVMPRSDKYILDHLHAAGYSYNNPEDRTLNDHIKKINEATQGIFNNKQLSGKAQPYWPSTGNRAGVTNLLYQRGDNLTNWRFNKAPTNGTGTTWNHKFFKISPSLAYDWEHGKPHVALMPTGTYSHPGMDTNKPLFVESKVTNHPWINDDIENFENWPEAKQAAVARYFSDLGFTTKSTVDLKNKNRGYNPAIIKSILMGIKSGKYNLTHPTEGHLNGNNSYYKFSMGQNGKYTGKIYQHSITGLQNLNNQLYTFNQDFYDISPNIGNIQLFNNGTWYKNMTPVMDVEKSKIKYNVEH